MAFDNAFEDHNLVPVYEVAQGQGKDNGIETMLPPIDSRLSTPPQRTADVGSRFPDRMDTVGKGVTSWNKLAENMEASDGRNVKIWLPFRPLVAVTDFVGQVGYWAAKPYEMLRDWHEESKYQSATKYDGSIPDFAAINRKEIKDDVLIAVASVAAMPFTVPVGIITGLIAATQRLLTGKSTFFPRMRDLDYMTGLYRGMAGLADTRHALFHN
ncbi:MAG: hypothetical protein Q7R74_00925 [bacterium]|nr:hypothetical protein [bacterium]